MVSLISNSSAKNTRHCAGCGTRYFYGSTPVRFSNPPPVSGNKNKQLYLLPINNKKFQIKDYCLLLVVFGAVSKAPFNILLHDETRGIEA